MAKFQKWWKKKKTFGGSGSRISKSLDPITSTPPAHFLPQLLHHPFPHRQRIPNVPAHPRVRELPRRQRIVDIAVDAVGVLVVLAQIGPGEGHAEGHLARAGQDVRVGLGGRFGRQERVPVGGGGGAGRGIVGVAQGGRAGGGGQTEGVGLRVQGVDRGRLAVVVKPGERGGGGGGVVVFDQRGPARREVDFLGLEEGRKAKLDGFVEFLGRGQIDAQFESGFGVLVVSCRGFDHVSRRLAGMRRRRGFGGEGDRGEGGRGEGDGDGRGGFGRGFGFGELGGDVGDGGGPLPSRGRGWIRTLVHGRSATGPLGRGETASKGWPAGGGVGRFGRRGHVQVVVVQGQIQIVVLVHPSKTIHHRLVHVAVRVAVRVAEEVDAARAEGRFAGEGRRAQGEDAGGSGMAKLAEDLVGGVGNDGQVTAEVVEGVGHGNDGVVPAAQQQLFLAGKLRLLDFVRQAHEPLGVGLGVKINWRGRGRLSETSVGGWSAPWISVEARERGFPGRLEGTLIVSRPGGGDGYDRLLCQSQSFESGKVL